MRGILVVVVLGLAGCGGGADTPPAAQTPTPAPVRVTGHELEWRVAEVAVEDRGATAAVALTGKGQRALLVTRSARGVAVHRLEGFVAETVHRARRAFWPPRGDAAGAELLVRERGRLRLVRIDRRGRERGLWSRPAGRVQAQLARSGDRTAIWWRDARGRQQLVFGRERRFARPVTVRGLELDEDPSVQDLAITGNGDAVLAFADLAGEGLAVVTPDGRVREQVRHRTGSATRQRLAVSDAGRLAALVDETGAEALEDHECVGAGPRQVSAVVRGSIETLGRPALVGRVPWRCTQGDSTLVTGPGDRFATTFSGRVAVAAPGAGFGPPQRPWSGMTPWHAVVLGDGTLVALGVRGRKLVIDQLPVTPERVIAPRPALSALAATQDGSAAAVWRDRRGRWNVAWGR